MKTERLELVLPEPGDGDLVEQYSALLPTIETKLFLPDGQNVALPCNGHRITDLPAPVDSTCLARKADVDALARAPLIWMPLTYPTGQSMQLSGAAGNDTFAAGMSGSWIWLIDDINGWQSIYTGLSSNSAKQTAASPDHVAFVRFDDLLVFVDETGMVTTETAPYCYDLVWGGDAWVISSGNGEIYVRTGEGWVLSATLSLPSRLYGLGGDGAGTLVGTDSDGFVHISRDGGWTWDAPIDIGQYNYSPVCAIKNGRWFLAFSNSQVCYSDDDLQTFNLLSHPLGVWYDVVEKRGALLVRDVYKDMAISYDGGNTWQVAPRLHSYNFLTLGGQWPVILRDGSSIYMRTPVGF